MNAGSRCGGGQRVHDWSSWLIVHSFPIFPMKTHNIFWLCWVCIVYYPCHVVPDPPRATLVPSLHDLFTFVFSLSLWRFLAATLGDNAGMHWRRHPNFLSNTGLRTVVSLKWWNWSGFAAQGSDVASTLGGGWDQEECSQQVVGLPLLNGSAKAVLAN